MTTLMPCPFCGSRVRMTEAPIFATKAILCDCCGADVMFYGAEKSKERITEKWNSRKNPHGEMRDSLIDEMLDEVAHEEANKKQN